MNVPVNSDVQTHQFDECIIIAESKYVRQIPRIVLRRIDRGYFSFTIYIPEDTACYVW